MKTVPSPKLLMDTIMEHFAVPTYNALASALQIDPATVYRVRDGNMPLNDRFIVRVMDITGWSLNRVRDLAGLKQEHKMLRPAPQHIFKV